MVAAVPYCEDALPPNLLDRRLRQEARPCHLGLRGRVVDSFQQPLVERDVDAHRFAGVAQERHRDQEGAFCLWSGKRKSHRQAAVFGNEPLAIGPGKLRPGDHQRDQPVQASP